MTEKLIITKTSGEKLESDLITAFQITKTGKKYVIYSFDEKDANGLYKLYVSEMIENADKKQLTASISEEEWNSIKDIMRSIITQSPGTEHSYINNPMEVFIEE